MEPPGGPGITGAVQAGNNITISPDGTISSSGGGGGGGLTGLQQLDNIATQFNGTTTVFTLKIATSNLPSGTNASQLVIFIGGAAQTPNTAFTFNSATSQITFSSAPAAGRKFIGYVGGSASSTAGVTKLVSGTGITLNPTSGIGDVTISASGGSGTITGVTAGTNLSGGGTTGTVTLNLASTVTVSGQFISTSTGSGSSAAFLCANGMVRAKNIIATGELSVSPAGSEVWMQCGVQSNTTFNTNATQVVQITNTSAINTINTNTASVNINRPAKGTLYTFYYVAAGAPLWGVDQNGTAGPPSDISLKTNITPLDSLPGSYLDKVCNLTPVRFEYINAEGVEKFGLIAQDAELYAPELVNEAVLPAIDENGDFDSDLDVVADGTTIKNVDYQGLAIMTLQALQELKSEFDVYVASHP